MNNDHTESIRSKRQIIKSTGIVGGAQVVSSVLQIIRTKIVAYLLGPVGVGLLGIYNSIVDIIRQATGLGINFSGVREISQAIAENNIEAQSQKRTVLLRWALITGLLGAVLLIVSCKPISRLTFKDTSHCVEIAALSLAVFFYSISQAQLAILQGYRKISYLAKASIYGILLSIIVVMPIYYIYGINGMIPAIIIMAITSFLLSYYYINKIPIPRISLSFVKTISLGKEMILLGFASAISGIITTVSMYYLRTLISSHASIIEVGYFQAAWSVSNVYLLSVLNAMGADFFPRLSAVNKDNNKVNQLVNEQTEMAILIGAPLLIGMYILSDIVIRVLYSVDFIGSGALLRLFILGTFFKFLSWPICFIQAAKGSYIGILVSEISWNVIFVICSILLWNKFALIGIGISYVIAYLLYIVILFILVRPLSHFSWNRTTCRHILIYAILILSVVVMARYSACFGIFVLIGLAVYSLYHLKEVIDVKDILRKITRRSN